MSECLKELFARNRRDISKCNGTRPHSQLVVVGLIPAVISFSLLEQLYFRTILDNTGTANFHG